MFSIFGDTEIKVLAVLGASFLLGTQLWTAVCVKEKVLVSSSCVSLARQWNDLY